MPLRYKPQPVEFDKIEYKNEVNAELNGGREINALFLVHGYIEAYLLDWLYYVSGVSVKDKLSKQIIKNIENISFYQLLNVHLILGTIDIILHKKILELNKKRNEIAHEIITIDTADPKTKEHIKKVVLFGIETCDEIVKLYKKTLDERAKKL